MRGSNSFGPRQVGAAPSINVGCRKRRAALPSPAIEVKLEADSIKDNTQQTVTWLLRAFHRQPMFQLLLDGGANLGIVCSQGLWWTPWTLRYRAIAGCQPDGVIRSVMIRLCVIAIC